MDKHFSDPWYWICVREAMAMPEFVANWMRLTGIAPPKSELDRMIDEASGYGSEVARRFLADVKGLVYDRLPRPEVAHG